MIRDLINIYHKREMLNVPCPSCQNFGHSIIKCPLVNYVPNKALILDHFKESRDRMSLSSAKKTAWASAKTWTSPNLNEPEI